MITKNRVIAALVGLVLILDVMACSGTQKEKATEERQQDNYSAEIAAASTGFARLSDSQQVPAFDYSQERQTLIDIETIRASGTHGTAYATTLGGELLWWCPTVGSPVPSTYMLTPSQAYVDIPADGTTAKFPVDQGESTGVYQGESAATWTLCLDANGNIFAKYEEANVGWTSGVVNGLPADKRARVDEITFEFTLPEDEG